MGDKRDVGFHANIVIGQCDASIGKRSESLRKWPRFSHFISVRKNSMPNQQFHILLCKINKNTPGVWVRVKDLYGFYLKKTKKHFILCTFAWLHVLHANLPFWKIRPLFCICLFFLHRDGKKKKTRVAQLSRRIHIIKHSRDTVAVVPHSQLPHRFFLNVCLRGEQCCRLYIQERPG